MTSSLCRQQCRSTTMWSMCGAYDLTRTTASMCTVHGRSSPVPLQSRHLVLVRRRRKAVAVSAAQAFQYRLAERGQRHCTPPTSSLPPRVSATGGGGTTGELRLVTLACTCSRPPEGFRARTAAGQARLLEGISPRHTRSATPTGHTYHIKTDTQTYTRTYIHTRSATPTGHIHTHTYIDTHTHKYIHTHTHTVGHSTGHTYHIHTDTHTCTNNSSTNLPHLQIKTGECLS